MTAAKPNDDRVSVVIACYNQGRFLGEAISSVRQQSHHDIDVIVVDDGSTDNTAAVCRQFPETRYHYQSNRGLSAARNAGTGLAVGRYVVYLDADDRLLPNALEVGLTHMRERPKCGFVSGDHRYIDTAGNVTRSWSRPPIEHNHYVELLRSNYIGMGAAVLFRTAAVRHVGGFDPGLPACEDYDLYLRMAVRYPSYAHHQLVAEYRKHDGAMSADNRLMLRAAIRVLKRQTLMAGATAETRAALRQGLSYWREYYGPQLAYSAAANMRRSGRRSAGLGQLIELARLAPAHVGTALAALTGEISR